MCWNYMAHDRKVGTPNFGPFLESMERDRNCSIYLFSIWNIGISTYFQHICVILQCFCKNFREITPSKKFWPYFRFLFFFLKCYIQKRVKLKFFSWLTVWHITMIITIRALADTSTFIKYTYISCHYVEN